MSIIAHLRQVSPKQLKHFDEDLASAYSLILGNSLSSVRNMSQEVQDWKAKNALNLLKVINAGAKLENLNQEDRLVFEKAHLELGSISQRRIFSAMASPKKVPRIERGLSVRGAEDKEYLWTYFQKLKAFYSQATKQNNGVLSYLD